MKIFWFLAVWTAIACALGGDGEDFATAFFIMLAIFMVITVYVLGWGGLGRSSDSEIQENINSGFDLRYKGRIKAPGSD